MHAVARQRGFDPRRYLRRQVDPAARAAIRSAAGAVAQAFVRADVLPADYAIDDYLKYHDERLALDLRWLLDHTDSGQQLLEIGGFPFFLTVAATRAGRSMVSVDFPLDDIGQAARALNVTSIACNIEAQALAVASDSVDHVIFNEVFAHLRIDPIFTVRELRRVLKPGGTLWLSTPNLRSLRGLYNLLVKEEAWSAMGEGLFYMYSKVGTGGPAGHVREYTAREVSRFLGECGFEVEQVIYRGRYASLPAAALARLAPKLLPYFTIIARKPTAAGQADPAGGFPASSGRR